MEPLPVLRQACLWWIAPQVTGALRVAALAAAVSWLPACGPTPTGYLEPEAAPVQVYAVDVDTGETLEAAPGQSVGVFVEYAAGGDWYVWTTCDSDKSGYACGWDLIASVGATETLEVAVQEELEDPDRVLRIDRGALRLIFQTDSDTDGVHLAATPGEPLSLDLEWDGGDAPSLILSWIGGGAVHTGAPSNPVDFRPTTP